MDTETRFIDTRRESVDVTSGRLPHWSAPGACYFVTFRLTDSMAKEIGRMFVEEQRRAAELREPSAQARATKDLLRATEQHLDRGIGSCILADSKNAKLVHDAAWFFDGERYKLEASCIMPNHVHLVIQPFEEYPLRALLRSMKGYAARQVNDRLNRRGRLWQRESFDHLIRSPQSLERFVRYTALNPSLAGLSGCHWVAVRDEWKGLLDELGIKAAPIKRGSLLSSGGSPGPPYEISDEF